MKAFKSTPSNFLYIFISFFLYIINLSAADRPNILIAISDDQSFPHTSAYKSTMVKTPNFDRIAKEGILFTNAYSASPGCSPSRAAFLTGRHTWQIEEAGTHASGFQTKYETFPERLEKDGYFVGHSGKGWGPGKAIGRKNNPAGGKNYGKKYVQAFHKFMKERPKGKPFCYWFGSSDPHRGYTKGSGLKSGKKLSDANVPSFLPDSEEIRSDLLDYAFEIDRFDRDLGGILTHLKQSGEYENTIIIVTSDNGMPFPGAKANCFDSGIHVPLAIYWGKGIKFPGRTVEDLVSQIDITAALYEITGSKPPEKYPVSGNSILSLLASDKSGVIEAERTIYSARERHSSVRFNSLGYPQRCIRQGNFLFIWNIKPERWPAGAPSKLGGNSGYPKAKDILSGKTGDYGSGFHDVDGSPSLSYIVKNRNDSMVKQLFLKALDFRPEYELYDVSKDRGCLNNLASNPEFKPRLEELSSKLNERLKSDKDPRVSGNGDIWETYERYSGLRWFEKPKWAEENPKNVPKQDWLEKRRPK